MNSTTKGIKNNAYHITTALHHVSPLLQLSKSKDHWKVEIPYGPSDLHRTIFLNHVANVCKLLQLSASRSSDLKMLPPHVFTIIAQSSTKKITAHNHYSNSWNVCDEILGWVVGYLALLLPSWFLLFVWLSRNENMLHLQIWLPEFLSHSSTGPSKHLTISEQNQHLRQNPCMKRRPWSNTFQRICNLTQNHWRSITIAPLLHASIFHFTDFPSSRLVKNSSAPKQNLPKGEKCRDSTSMSEPFPKCSHLPVEQWQCSIKCSWQPWNYSWITVYSTIYIFYDCCILLWLVVIK